MKALLSQWGIDYHPLDVEAQPEQVDRLRAAGVPAVPALEHQGRFVHGWQPGAYAKLLGVQMEAREILPPGQLEVRLDILLVFLEYLALEAGMGNMGLRHPGRDRDLRQLFYHTVRVAQAFVDCMEQGMLQEAWLDEQAPADMKDITAFRNYSGEVRLRLQVWFALQKPAVYQGIAQTYYGPQGVHDLLERTVWHCAQHLRQITALLEEAGVLPPGSLPPLVLKGLPMPDAVW